VLKRVDRVRFEREIRMPTYQYRCSECGDELEAVQKFTDPALTECPACAGRLRKVFNAVGVVFKGSGFYRTDSRAADTKADSTTTDTKADATEKSSEKKSSEKKSSEKKSSETGSSSEKSAGKQPATAGSSSGSSSGASSTAA
jgi:putative FmdB family regulatory protein